MRHINKIFALLIFSLLLVGCNNDSERIFSLDEVLSALEKENVNIEEVTINERIVLQMELNGVKPNVFALDKGTLSIYVFPSSEELEKGKEDFKHKTATASLEPFKEYEINNILIFYTEGSELAEKKIQTTIDGLTE